MRIKKRQFTVTGGRRIKILQYPTIDACLAAYHRCKPSEISALQGNWEWLDAEGNHFSMDHQEAFKRIRRRKCWGWVGEKNSLHCFIRKGANLKDKIKFFAHELGHLQRPFHRSLIEEQKANKYAEVADQALSLSIKIGPL